MGLFLGKVGGGRSFALVASAFGLRLSVDMENDDDYIVECGEFEASLTTCMETDVLVDPFGEELPLGADQREILSAWYCSYIESDLDDFGNKVEVDADIITITSPVSWGWKC